MELNTEFVGSGFMSSKNQTDGCMLVVGLIIFYINLGEYMKYKYHSSHTIKQSVSYHCENQCSFFYINVKSLANTNFILSFGLIHIARNIDLGRSLKLLRWCSLIRGRGGP